MFSNTINKAELSEVAEMTLGLLETYQNKSPAAKNVLDRSKDLMRKAVNMEIESPIASGFFPEEFWQDGDLFVFVDLVESVSRFNLLLMGAESIGEIRRTVREIERQAEKEELKLRGKE